MKALTEFLIICLAALAGVFLSSIPAFPFPGTVTGMVIMLILLLTKRIKLIHIEKIAGLLLEIMPLFFIPLIINLLKEKDIFRQYGIKILLVIIFTTFLTLIITGLTAKLMIRLINKEHRHDA